MDKVENNQQGNAEHSPDAGVVAVELTYDARVNFAMQQNDVPVVKRLEVRNTSAENLQDLAVSLRIEPGFGTAWSRNIEAIGPGLSVVFTEVAVELRPEKLINVAERERGELQIEVSRGADLIHRATHPVEILAYNEWHGTSSLPEILAAFVQPNHPAIERILVAARASLEKLTGDGSLSGYQSKDPNRIRAIGAAIWQAAAGMGIGYVNPPASFETTGQKIRSPDQILDSRLGTCIDLAVLLAAAWEQVGLHPLVVLLEGHAVAGFWLADTKFHEAAVPDGLRLRKRVDLGDIDVVECTGLTSKPAMDFDAARAAGRRQLDSAERIHYAIDVAAARVARIRPIPPRTSKEGFVLVEPSVPEAKGKPLSGTTTILVDISEALASAAKAPEPLPPGASRIERWKRELLDLSLRNRLLNFRPTSTTLQLMAADLALLEDKLAAGKSMRLASKPRIMSQDDPRSPDLHMSRTGEDPVLEFIRKKLDEGIVHSPVTSEELTKRLTAIHRAARSSLEENGSNSLYLALGFVGWFESPSASQRRMAPIILLPLTLHRKSAREGFRLELADEDPELNVTLLRKLKDDHGIDVPGVEEMPEDGSGIDVDRILSAFRSAIVDKDRWEVVNEAHIGLFSFTKFLMWRDLEERSDDILTNEIVAHMVDPKGNPYPAGSLFPDPTTFDRARAATETFCVLDADSSQLGAVHAADDGMSFVIEGPPGTGKSQTIANLVAQNLARGKTVLFVAEKRAALEVVHQRLKKVGLGEFTLELHSNKSSKRDVLDQFAATLELERRVDDTAAKAVLSRLDESREEVNRYTRALHGRRAIGMTLHDALSRLCALEAAPRVADAVEDPGAMTQPRLDEMRRSLAPFVDAAKGIGAIASHPLAPIALQEWNPSLGDELEKSARAASTASQELSRAANAVAATFGGWPTRASRDDLDACESLLALLEEMPGPCAGMLRESNWSDRRAAIESWVAQGRAVHAARQRLFARYRPGILDVDLEDLIASFDKAQRSLSLVNFFTLRGPKAAVQAQALGQIPGEPAGVLKDLREAQTLRDDMAKLVRMAADAPRLLGSLWRELDTDWTLVETCVDWAGRVRLQTSKVRSRGGAPAAAFAAKWLAFAQGPREEWAAGTVPGDAIRDYRKAYDAWIEARKRLVSSFALSESEAYGTADLPDHLARMIERLESLAGAKGELRSFCGYRRAAFAAREAKLAPFVDEVESGRCAAADIEACFERSFLDGWVEAVIDGDPLLRAFDRPTHEGRLGRFRELDKKVMEAAQVVVRSKLATGLPQAQDVSSKTSEMGLLQREIKKQRAHLPVRRLLQRIPTLLPVLKPCLLMSPLSVAQYLDPAFPPADVVIFDEASQIPIQDAIGALARGRQAIIVGDSKQLPPTTFFTRLAGNEEIEPDEEDIEELESILDEAIAIGMPRHYLRWHYRSKHESLIDFSNGHYYENKLFTFPTAAFHAPDLGVRWRHVPDGHYDRAKTGTNAAEARAVVDELLARLRSGGTKSIGIITMSLVQQQLVEDLIDESRQANPDIDAILAAENGEGVFVKNLENVQGDERDVILISIGYGPDEKGNVMMNFGPLNRAGGERRLNVAVTRARRELIAFSTLRPEQIDLLRTAAVGVAHLKSFLEYAATGRLPVVAANVEARATGGIERRLADRLKERGHDVRRAIGRSAYRIDLAVVDPEDADTYLLGIESDGASYSAAATARDRDRLRSAVLESLGWRLVRTWSLDAHYEFDREVERLDGEIKKAAENARKRRDEKLASAPPAVAPSPQATSPAVAAVAAPLQPTTPATAAAPIQAAVPASPAAPSTSGNDRTTPAAAPRPTVVGADQDPEATLELKLSDIEDRIAAAQGMKSPSPRQESDTPASRAVAAGRAVVYTMREVDGFLGSSDEFFADATTAAVVEELRQIVAIEAPVSFQRAVSSLLERWQIKRATKRAQDRILAVLDLKKDPRNPALINGFLWAPKQEPSTYDVFRVPAPASDAPRAAEELPAEEVANAAFWLLEAHVAIDLEELHRETAKLFGISRLGKVVVAAMEAGTALLAARGRCVIEEGRIRLER